MKTKEEKAAKKQRLKRQLRNKHIMEVVRTTCSFLGLALNMWVVAHIYFK